MASTAITVSWAMPPRSGWRWSGPAAAMIATPAMIAATAA
jgi:hypothetical protein